MPYMRHYALYSVAGIEPEPVARWRPMSEDKAPPRCPAETPETIAAKAARRQREAAALRANLKKRKEQARARERKKYAAEPS